MIGYPRLVRLNPNIPWKTRGNGAISIKLENGNRKVVRKILEGLIDRYAKFDDNKTNPCYLILEEQPSIDIYEKAVKKIVHSRKLNNC